MVWDYCWMSFPLHFVMHLFYFWYSYQPQQMMSFEFSPCSLILELNRNSHQELVPNDFDFLFSIHNMNNLFPVVVHAWRWCLNLNGEEPILVYWGSNTFEYLLACQNMFDPNWTNIECSAFKPPHYLQECTANLWNMERIVCKKTASWPKVITLVYG